MELIANILVGVVIGVTYVVAVAWLSSRILGVRLGRWRGLVAGTVGFLSGVIAAAVVSGGTVELDWDSGFVILFFGVLATMVVSIVLDVVTRSGRVSQGRGRRFLVHPARTVKGFFAPYGRMREVMGNARRENLIHVRYASLSALESADFARRLRLVLEDSGGMFVKFGQIASTRGDLLPDVLTDELGHLRADVRPVPADDVREVLEAELGESVDTAFASFEWEPLAAASIGQTHRATLQDGTRVVVKVQRPGIDDVVRRDASVLRLVAGQLERRVEAAQRVGVCELAEELIAGIEEELDYTHEASVGSRLRENRADDEGIAIPAVHRTLSTSRVLVMDEILGTGVDDAASVDACGVSRSVLARRLLASFLGQVLHDGLYHADPHPGNLFVDVHGTLWFLDFGSVGRLDPVSLEGLQGLAIAFSLQDANLLARAVSHLAGDDGATDLRSLEGDLGVILGDVNAGGGIDPQVVMQVLAVMERHGLHTPRSISLLSRALLTLEGTLKMLDPTFDLAVEGERVVSRDRKDVIDSPQEMVKRELLRALPSLRTLPGNVEALTNQLRSGRLTVRTESFSGGDRRVVDRWVDRLLVAATGGFGALASAGLLVAAGLTADKGVQDALWLLGFAGLTFSTALLMRSVAQALRRLPPREDDQYSSDE